MSVKKVFSSEEEEIEYHKIRKEKNRVRKNNYNKLNPEKRKLEAKRYYRKNWDKIKEVRVENKEKLAKASKEWSKRNRERAYELNAQYRERNKDKISKRGKLYKEKNKVAIAKRRSIQEKEKKLNPVYKLSTTIRSLIRDSFIRNGLRKSGKTENILGCSIEFFIEYILSKCPEGITISDFGKFGYHIDHRIPISIAKTEEEVIKLCHYTNLQPLFWRDNLSKSNKIIEIL